jgi:hypothetical protein
MSYIISHIKRKENMLKKIKKLIESGKYRFTFKAELEITSCWITGEEALNTVINASKIDKIENSYNKYTNKSEKLYIFKKSGFYVKGKLSDNCFIIISCKFDTDSK